MEDVLINDLKHFERETIEGLKKEFNFSQSRHIEMLLWDFEILAHLLEFNKNFFLKGGAATQIYLPHELQRASRDIDIATTLSKEDIEKALENIKLKFQPHVKNEEHFTWQNFQPQNIKEKIEDLNVYLIIVPTKIESSSEKEGSSYLHIDTIYYNKLPFKTKEISSPSVLGRKFKPLLIISEGSLIADKILTLADNTVGILSRRDDLEGYLKQVYDLNHLIKGFITNIKVLEDLIFTLKKLTPIELKYRKLDISLKDVLIDIIESLTKRENFDFEEDTNSQNLRDGIRDLQGNYLNKSEWINSQGWSARLGKLKFIIENILKNLNGKITLTQIIDKINKIQKIEDKLVSLKKEKLEEVRERLMEKFSGKEKTRKILKNTSLLRIFYGVLNDETFDKIIKDMEKI